MVRWVWIILLTIVIGSAGTDTCQQCHQMKGEFAPFHAPERIGCSACHLGTPTALDKNKAHAGMISVPGNVAVMDQTCGKSACHPTLTQNMHRNIMNSGRGIVAVDRWVFGEAPTPDGPGHLSQLDTTGADLHLRQLCATCHLAFPKRRPAQITQRSRGGGCVACHLKYSDTAEKEWTAFQQTGRLPTVHPRLTIQVEDRHCFGCHSRSGRISTNYQGWHETLFKAVPSTRRSHYWQLEDGRVLEKQMPDVHFTRGLQCIDCHTWQETMGDGKSHVHEEDQQEVQCMDCHFTEKPQLAKSSDFTLIDWKLLALRKFSLNQFQPLVTHKRRQVLINAGLDKKSNSFKLIGKNTGREYSLNPPPNSCTRNVPGHEHLSCQSCHTAWAPRCVACHVGFKPDVPGKDHLTGKTTHGRWVEYRALFLAQFPTLGMVTNGNQYRIEPFVPGMILTINTLQQSDDQPMYDFDSFRRLFAPVTPHTIQARGVDCQTCHQNPVALGYGEGHLTLQQNSRGQWQWVFTPRYASHPADSLPLDAWIPFLSDQVGMATRTNARSLPLAVQERILRVGACLTCHSYDPGNPQFYLQFKISLQNTTEKCRVPHFRSD